MYWNEKEGSLLCCKGSFFPRLSIVIGKMANSNMCWICIYFVDYYMEDMTVTL